MHCCRQPCTWAHAKLLRQCTANSTKDPFYISPNHVPGVPVALCVSPKGLCLVLSLSEAQLPTPCLLSKQTAGPTPPCLFVPYSVCSKIKSYPLRKEFSEFFPNCTSCSSGSSCQIRLHPFHVGNKPPNFLCSFT